MFEWFAFGLCFKDCSLILVSERDAAKNISSFLGICSMFHSQVKAWNESWKWKLKVANYLGKTAVAWGSELTGIWGCARTDCSGFSGTLMWAFATQSAGQRECCELQALLPLSPLQCSAARGYWFAVLFCFPKYWDWWPRVSGRDGCVWGQRLHASACFFCVRWSGVREVPADVIAL